MSRLALAALTVALVTANAARAESPPGQPTAWKRWHGANLRLDADGQLSCYSRDGLNCVWNGSIPDANAPDVPAGKPLVCGEAHAATAWQVNGYNDAQDRHWCREAYAQLYAKWQDYSSLGHPYLLSETPEGDTMCYSTDGATCAPARRDAPSRNVAVRPLVCGKHLEFKRGATGYESDHQDAWCRSPRIVVQDRDVKLPPVCTAKPGQDACPGWHQATTAWSTEDQPALIVRGTRHAGDRLTLEAGVHAHNGLEALDVPAFMRVNEDAQIPASLVGPMRRSPFAAPGPFVAALQVSRGGRLCYFGETQPAGTAPQPLFRHGSYIGSSFQEDEVTGVPHITVVGSAWDPRWRGVSVYSWNREMTVDDITIVVARNIPVGNGERRRIPYGFNCDD